VFVLAVSLSFDLKVRVGSFAKLCPKGSCLQFRKALTQRFALAVSPSFDLKVRAGSFAQL